MTLDEIQNQAIQTYNQNLEYFRINHPNIYKNIELFNAAIDLKQISPQFDLQFTNGYFDIKSTKTNEFLYRQNSNEISQQLTDAINLDATINSFKAYYEHNYNDFTAKLALESDILESSMLGNAPIVHCVNKNLPKPEILKDVHKFIIFGVLLGLHIPTIHKKLNSKVYLIVEPNLEFFRLSMFVTNYANLAKETKLFFSIAQNEFDFKQTFEQFYGELFIFNHYLKFINLSDSCEMYMKVIQNHLVSQAHFLYSYERTFLSLSRTNSYISQDFKILNIKEKKQLSGFEKPILILGAGPSLDNNIDFVRKHQENFVIVAIYATLPILERNGIVPDIITQYDEQDTAVLNTLDKLNNIKFFKNSIFLFSSHINSKLMNSFPKNNIFIYQAMFELKQNFGTLTSPSIGELTYALMLTLGAKNIYLLGLDFALDNETGLTHIEGHSGSNIFNQLKEEEESSDKNYSFRKNTIKIKGNFLAEVKSVPVFKADIDTFNIFTATLKDTDVNVFNLSNGAYLNDTTPLPIKDIDFDKIYKLEKNDIKTQIFNSLTTNSETGYNEKDLEKINLKISSVKKIRKYLEKFYKIKNYKNIEDYKNNLINTIQYILFEKHHCEDLQSILLNFSSHNIHHIFHLLSLENSTDEKKFIYELNKAIYTQFDKIINTYIICVTYSQDENSNQIKKLNKYLKENSVKGSIYSEPFFKELVQTSKKGAQVQFKENNIGFFASEDNLENKEFISYVKELLSKFDKINFKLFYFFDYQKILAKHIFKESLEKIELLYPHNLEDITSNIEIWMESSERTTNLIKVNDIILNNYENISSIMFNKNAYLSQIGNSNFSIKNHLANKIEKEFFIPNTEYYNFAESFKNGIKEEELFEKHKKETIGLFAFKENIQKDFIAHIATIYNKFPNLRFSIFYFDKNIKNEFSLIFHNMLSRFEFIKPKDIFDIAQNTEIWIQAKIKNQSFLFTKIYNLLQKSLYIYPIILDSDYELKNNSSYLKSLIYNFEEKSFVKELNKPLDETVLENINYKDNIGFLSTEDNLEDKNFIKFMNILFEKSLNTKYKAFYFNDEQKNVTLKVFEKYSSQIEFIQAKNIYDIVENISTYIHSYIKGKRLKSESYYKIWELLNKKEISLFKINLEKEIFNNDFANSLSLIDNSRLAYKNSIISSIFKDTKMDNEFSLINSLNTKVLNTVKHSFCKKTIGIIANNQNLVDHDFIEYINKLTQNISDVKFNIFYMNKEQKENFSLLINKNINFIKISSITEIIENVEILITNTQSSLDNIVYNKLESLLREVFIINFTKNKFKLDNFDNKILDSKKFINFITKNTALENIDINFLNKTNGNPYKIQNELNNLLKNSEKIDTQEYNDNFYNYIYFNLIKNILNNPDTKKLYLNQKIYRDK